MRLALPALVLVAAACGAASRPPLAPRVVPADAHERDVAIDEAGARIFGALRGGRVRDLLVDDVELRTLLTAEAATRLTQIRNAPQTRVASRDELAPLQGAQYTGVCLQGATVEPPGTPFGLRAEAWVFERALVVGMQPGGRRLASWVEGTFVFTNRGVVALDVSGAEPPRWEHSDLDLGNCDMEVGVNHPRPVVVVTD